MLFLYMIYKVLFLLFRLQTGMRGAFGKPQGTVARVHIGQVIMSVRTKTQNKEHVIEALRRAKFKFPGRQKVHLGLIVGFDVACFMKSWEHLLWSAKALCSEHASMCGDLK